MNPVAKIIGIKKYYNVMRGISEDFQESIELQQEIKSYGQVDKITKKIYDDIDYSEKFESIPYTASIIFEAHII